LAEKIVVVPDNEEEAEEEKKERPEDKLYDYNGKRIKVNLLKSDITDDIKDKAFEMGFEALNKYTAEKEMADYIKNEFDILFEPLTIFIFVGFCRCVRCLSRFCLFVRLFCLLQ